MRERQVCNKLILDVAFQKYKEIVKDERLLLKNKVNNLTYFYNQNINKMIEKCDIKISDAWEKYQETKRNTKE